MRKAVFDRSARQEGYGSVKAVAIEIRVPHRCLAGIYFVILAGSCAEFDLGINDSVYGQLCGIER